MQLLSGRKRSENGAAKARLATEVRTYRHREPESRRLGVLAGHAELDAEVELINSITAKTLDIAFGELECRCFQIRRCKLPRRALLMIYRQEPLSVRKAAHP
jgi:hypothetical protein